MGMGGRKNLGRVFVLAAFCGLIWWAYSSKEQVNQQVNQMEKDISNQYYYANLLLRNTVDALLEWDFSQPFTDTVEDEDYLYGLISELDSTTNLMFSGNVVHYEWRRRMDDILNYVRLYITDSSLSVESVADLQQALQATRFITMDFKDYIRGTDDFYDAMHDEKHEINQQIKNRLYAQY